MYEYDTTTDNRYDKAVLSLEAINSRQSLCRKKQCIGNEVKQSIAVIP